MTQEEEYISKLPKGQKDSNPRYGCLGCLTDDCQLWERQVCEEGFDCVTARVVDAQQRSQVQVEASKIK